ncbi:unnamed protein product [Closterium sp. NIES-53]
MDKAIPTTTIWSDFTDPSAIPSPASAIETQESLEFHLIGLGTSDEPHALTDISVPGAAFEAPQKQSQEPLEFHLGGVGASDWSHALTLLTETPTLGDPNESPQNYSQELLELRPIGVGASDWSRSLALLTETPGLGAAEKPIQGLREGGCMEEITAEIYCGVGLDDWPAFGHRLDDY